MSFPAYPKYRDSGVEWLGAVPADWRVLSLKRVAKFQTGWTPPTGRDDLYNGSNLWVTIGDMGERVVNQSAKQVTDEAIELVGIAPSPKGSLLFSFKLSIGQVAFAGCDLFTNEAIATFLSGSELDLSFGYYALPVFVVQNAAENIYGAKLLNQELIRNATIAMPSADEQIAIALFLDRETAKIDALIEEQRRLIALLKEKRQAVISHAVTKGLDPNAPMKDSGIEWLGMIPAHWTVRSLKDLVAAGSSISYGIVQPGEPQDSGVPFIQTTNMSNASFEISELQLTTAEIAEKYPRSRLAGGEVVLGIRASIGAAHIVPAHLCGANLSRGVARIDCSDKISAEYLVQYLRSFSAECYWQSSKQGSTFNEVSIDTVKRLAVPVAPAVEQKAISAFLEAKTKKSDAVIEQASATISLLQERRAALISAAVTGKIDVRETAKVLPFPVDRARARGLVAAEIIERCANQPTFGRVKFQKIAFLAEGHVGISELAGCYTREAAGPLDWALIEEMECGAQTIAGVERDQPGGPGTTVSYRLGQSRGAHRQELADWLGEERSAKLDKLIADFADLTTKGAEAVATLYGVWNDALIDGQSSSDDEIIAGFLNDWHSEKPKKFRAAELPTWLDWMRRHGIVPTGSGPKTTTGRLFV
nr:restriction endonuclease subunit S [Novosphingobium panipatense]